MKDAETALLMVGSGKGISFLFSRRADEKTPDDIVILDIEDLDNGLDLVLAYKENNNNPIIPLLTNEISEQISKTSTDS